MPPGGIFDSRQLCPADISSPGKFILLSGVWVWNGRGWWQTSMFSLHVTYFQIPQESSRFINNRISLFNYELGTDTLQSGVQTSIKKYNSQEAITKTRRNQHPHKNTKQSRKIHQNQHLKKLLKQSHQKDAQKSIL